jgi:hypothetical protein
MLAIGHNIPTSALPSTFGIVMSLSVSYGIHDLVWLAHYQSLGLTSWFLLYIRTASA